MLLTIVRHTTLNLTSDYCYGQSEIETASSFKKEAHDLQDRLDGTFSRTITSPLSRCTKLANVLAQQPVEVDSRLLEYHFGDWELKRWNDINSSELQPWMDNFVNIAPPNGESLIAMMKRVSLFLEELRAGPDEHILIVTHSGVIRCIYACFLEISLQNLFKIGVGYGDLHRFNLGPTKNEDTVLTQKH